MHSHSKLVDDEAARVSLNTKQLCGLKRLAVKQRREKLAHHSRVIYFYFATLRQQWLSVRSRRPETEPIGVCVPDVQPL